MSSLFSSAEPAPAPASSDSSSAPGPKNWTYEECRDLMRAALAAAQINQAMPAKAFTTEQAAGCGMIASIHATVYRPGMKHAEQGRTPDTVCQRLIDLCNWSGLGNAWTHRSVTLQLKKNIGTFAEDGTFCVDKNNDLVRLVEEYKKLEASLASSAILGPRASTDKTTVVRPTSQRGAAATGPGGRAASSLDDVAELEQLASNAEYSIVEQDGFYFCGMCESALDPPKDSTGVCSDPSGSCEWAASVKAARARAHLMSSTSSTADLMESKMPDLDAVALLTSLSGAAAGAGAGADGGGGRRAQTAPVHIVAAGGIPQPMQQPSALAAFLAARARGGLAPLVPPQKKPTNVSSAVLPGGSMSVFSGSHSAAQAALQYQASSAASTGRSAAAGSIFSHATASSRAEAATTLELVHRAARLRLLLASVPSMAQKIAEAPDDGVDFDASAAVGRGGGSGSGDGGASASSGSSSGAGLTGTGSAMMGGAPRRPRYHRGFASIGLGFDADEISGSSSFGSQTGSGLQHGSTVPHSWFSDSSVTTHPLISALAAVPPSSSTPYAPASTSGAAAAAASASAAHLAPLPYAATVPFFALPAPLQAAAAARARSERSARAAPAAAASGSGGAMEDGDGEASAAAGDVRTEYHELSRFDLDPAEEAAGFASFEGIAARAADLRSRKRGQQHVITLFYNDTVAELRLVSAQLAESRARAQGLSQAQHAALASSRAHDASQRALEALVAARGTGASAATAATGGAAAARSTSGVRGPPGAPPAVARSTSASSKTSAAQRAAAAAAAASTAASALSTTAVGATVSSAGGGTVSETGRGRGAGRGRSTPRSVAAPPPDAAASAAAAPNPASSRRSKRSRSENPGE